MKNEIRQTLLSMAEPEYGDFSAKLMPTVDRDTVIGIRVPLLRKYAKSLTDYGDFLADLPHKYFEENNLHGFLLDRERDFDRCIEKLDAFLPYVDNWATCDSMKPRVLKGRPEQLLPHILRWLKSHHVYTVRYAINLLMSYYLDEDFQESYLQLVADIRSEEYYINMMRAWYFATALAKQYEATLSYIENAVLDKWTHNKAIQKAVESCRITKEQKEYLRTLKIKG